jgi:hypothetical protein
MCREGSGNREYCYSTINPDAPYRDTSQRPKRQVDAQPRKKFRRKIDTSKWMVFTAAQNATPVHKGFFSALKLFAEHQDAELCVIPMRYKNPTSVFSASQRNKENWLRDVAEQELADADITFADWDDNLDELEQEFGITVDRFTGCWANILDQYSARYLYEQRRKLNDNLVVVGDVKVQPTRDDPLSTFTGMTHGESGIFGHTSLRLQCVPTPQNKLPKIITTTGACTIENYTDSAAGKTGEFHHVLGAVVVEIEGPKKFHMYHINARSDGAFIFIDTEYHPDGTITDAQQSQALVFGDAHWRFVNKDVDRATFAPGGLVDVLNPPVLVWHDLLDCYWGNPHNAKNPFITIAKHKSDFHLARDEVEQTIAWMEDRGAGRENVIVASNHDDMFARWIIREDWKDHPDNAEFYLETALQMARSAKMADTGAQYTDPFGYWVEQLRNPNSNVTVLRTNQSYTIDGIELSMHGDKGPKGARGTIKNFAKIGVKSMTGHGHSPAYYHGHTRVGTMITDAEYVQGPNDWLPAHGAIDAFGKRHLHFCIDGNFGFGITPE